MSVYAIVIKKASGKKLVKFKSMDNKGKKVRRFIKQQLAKGGHTLEAINYVSESPWIDYDYPKKGK